MLQSRPKLPTVLARRQKKKKCLRIQYTILIITLCIFSYFIILLSMVKVLKSDGMILYRHFQLFLLYMAVVMNVLANFMVIIMWSVGILKNVFILLRPLLIITYVGLLISIIHIVVFSIRDSESTAYFLIPSILQMLSTLYLNLVVCIRYQGRLFTSRPPEQVSKIHFGVSVMKEIGKAKKIKKEPKKEVKHNKLEEEQPTCTICCLPFDQEPAFELKKCEHSFHQQCIQAWLQRKNTSCPLCRDEVFEQP